MKPCGSLTGCVYCYVDTYLAMKFWFQEHWNS